MQSGSSYRRHGKARKGPARGTGPARGGRSPGNWKELPTPPLSPGTLPAPTQCASVGRSCAQRAVSSRLNAFQKAERSGGRGRAQKPRPRSITGHGTSLHQRPPPGRPRRGAASAEAPHRAAGGRGRRSLYGSGARRGRRSVRSPPTAELPARINGSRAALPAPRAAVRCQQRAEMRGAVLRRSHAQSAERPRGPRTTGGTGGRGGGRPRAPPAATRPRGERRGGAA